MSLRKLLVANRGEIARRIFRTAREMGIATVAVYSDPDAAAPFVREADEAVSLGGATPAASYLRGEVVIDAARRTGAQAIHPGYGFLAENAEFAQAVLDAGIAWVGPSPDAIAAMGSKIAARDRLAAAGVPVLPGEPAGDDGAAVAERVGYPILVKASAGGGGKGMRVVRDPAELESAVAAAGREALSAFGDGTLLLERYVDEPRHVEIQILGDRHGRVVHLGERECSIQRRHQKILEESPSPALDAALRERMGAAAVAAGEALGYESAGTVEFLLAPDGSFFFLEVNTRLQVEHPVTEMVTGLDLVRLQLEIAQGGSVPEVPAPRGHAIEVRLYAEDPLRDFLPAIGRLERFVVPAAPGVRIDSGVEDGSEITIHYDPLLAKVIAHGAARDEAASRLARALREAEIHGPTTNRDFLVRLLEHPEFLAGRTDTHFLERHPPSELGAPLVDPDARRVHAAAAALAAQAERRASAPVLGRLPSGWRNNPSDDQHVLFDGAGDEIAVAYRFGRDGLAGLALDGQERAARLHECSGEEVVLEVEGVRRTYRVRRDGPRHHVNSALGQADLLERPRHPSALDEEPAGSLVSPMPGSVLRVAAEQGARVERGALLVVIEAMKMEHEIVAPVDGTLSELRVAAGAQVEAGAVLAVIDEDG